MKNISQIDNCYGCGVCAIVCRKEIIKIRQNEEGFYKPFVIDENSCTNCGLCVEVCAYSHEELASSHLPVKCYAAWSKDEEVRGKCSSGGVCFELGRTLIERGYKICGVRYNVEFARAEHYVATTVQELVSSIGSKYIQSYTVNGFESIDRKEKFLVTGTPCQIDSFRRYIQRFNVEDNFILVDFFCHGVPSMHLWKKYLKEVEAFIGEINYVSWRNKFTGWHDSWSMVLKGKLNENKGDEHDTYDCSIKRNNSFYNSRLSKGDLFYGFFLSDACLGRACYEKCKYKYDRSSSDIRIGDLWGKTYQYDEKGVNAVVAFTEKGDDLLRLSGCERVEHTFAVVAEGQMKTCPEMPQIRKWLLERFQSDNSLRSTMLLYKFYCFPRRIIHKFNRILKWEK